MKIINNLFNDFHRLVMRIGVGCPIPNMYRICGTLLPINQIISRKLMFVYHLANLPTDTVAGAIFQSQKTSKTGIFGDMEHHLEKMNITSLVVISKWSYKRQVKKYIFDKNKQDLISMAESYKKIDMEEFTNDDFKRKQYFYTMNIEQVRYKYRIDNKMVATIRKNFSNKYRNSSLSCQSCRHLPKNSNNNASNITTNRIPDTQTHVLYECEAFSHLREQLDTRDELQLIQFFKQVVEERTNEGCD